MSRVSNLDEVSLPEQLDVDVGRDVLAIFDIDQWDCRITAQPRSADAAALRLAMLEPTIAVFG